jgi:hypothetical protein
MQIITIEPKINFRFSLVIPITLDHYSSTIIAVLCDRPILTIESIVEFVKTNPLPPLGH